MNLVEDLNIQIYSQTVINGVSKEINGVLGNVNVSIPLEESQIIDKILQKHHGLSYPEKKCVSSNNL